MKKIFVKEVYHYKDNYSFNYMHPDPNGDKPLIAKFINGDEKQYLVKYEDKLTPVSKFYYVNYLLNRKRRIPSQVKVSLWFKFQRFYYSL